MVPVYVVKQRVSDRRLSRHGAVVHRPYLLFWARACFYALREKDANVSETRINNKIFLYAGLPETVFDFQVGWAVNFHRNVAMNYRIAMSHELPDTNPSMGLCRRRWRLRYAGSFYYHKLTEIIVFRGGNWGREIRFLYRIAQRTLRKCELYQIKHAKERRAKLVALFHSN